MPGHARSAWVLPEGEKARVSFLPRNEKSIDGAQENRCEELMRKKVCICIKMRKKNSKE